MRRNTRIWLPLVIAAALVAALFAAPGAASASRLHGRVTGVYHSHYFGLRTSQGRYRIYTNHGTDWNGCDWGWRQRGKRVGVRARHRSSGRWVAKRIAPWSDQWWGGMGHDHHHHHHGGGWW
jgi:hypothetical protein